MNAVCPPAALSLPELCFCSRDFDAFLAPVEGSETAISEAWQLLTDSERVCTQRYGAVAARKALIMRRGQLKRLLAERYGGQPNDFNIEFSSTGKPRVVWKAFADTSVIPVSTASNGHWCLFAVSKGKDIGADIESSSRARDLWEMRYEVLSEAEHRALARMPQPTRLHATLAAWVAKEACAKALGLGLRLDFGELTVLQTEHESEMLLSQVTLANSILTLMPVPSPEGCLAIVAVLTERAPSEPTGEILTEM